MSQSKMKKRHIDIKDLSKFRDAIQWGGDRDEA